MTVRRAIPTLTDHTAFVLRAIDPRKATTSPVAALFAVFVMAFGSFCALRETDPVAPEPVVEATVPIAAVPEEPLSNTLPPAAPEIVAQAVAQEVVAQLGEAVPFAVKPAGPSVEATPAAAPDTPLDLSHTTREGGRLVATRADGSKVGLTLVPDLQQGLQGWLDATRVSYGALVLLDVRTGDVLAFVEHRDNDEPGTHGGLVRADVPAASVFKTVTAVALTEAGVSGATRTCYNGGKHGLGPEQVKDGPKDRACMTLAEAFARSTNSVLGKLAAQKLTTAALLATAERLGFNRDIPFEIPVQPSTAAFADTPVARANAGAGFKGSTLSPLHGALLAAAIANGGRLLRPRIKASADKVEPEVLAKAVDPAVAARVAVFMRATATEGTGFKTFSKPPRSLVGIPVAGKTGSLSGGDAEHYRHHSWFVGFAPADKPEVAVAALAVNGLKWKVKGPVMAREALGQWAALVKGRK